MLAISALPLVRPLHLFDPMDAARSLADRPHPFLLHSSLEGERAHWSFFGADPFAVFAGDGYPDAIALWRRCSAESRSALPSETPSPFIGGAVGYWAYDFGRRLEGWRAPARTRPALDDLALPDVMLALYDVVGAFDHFTGASWLFSSGFPLEGTMRLERAQQRLEEFAWRLTASHPPRPEPAWRAATQRAVSTFTPSAYRQAIETVREHIRRGDIYQANLSQRWSLPIESHDPTLAALALHRTLARRSPAPFAAWLGAGDHAVASASPERFLELREGRVEARPIKGTRPRGASEAEDRALAAELLASEKDRAENVMIVDVLRNDLGRVCENGSVEAPALCELESFPQVHHLTSTVTGRLRSGLDAFDLLHACFPGGSITGAPKLRAMEILDSLEPAHRHIYCGSVGYLDWRGGADWNIAIRTALVLPNAVQFAAGGGIVADSDPEAEYSETLHKAEGLRLAIGDTFGPVALEPEAAHAG